MAKAILRMKVGEWQIAKEVGTTTKVMDALWCRHLVHYKGGNGKKVEWKLTQIGTFVRKGLRK